MYRAILLVLTGLVAGCADQLAARQAYIGRFVIVPLPNITNVFYGRDVGYTVERIVLDEATESISATKVRRLSAGP